MRRRPQRLPENAAGGLRVVGLHAGATRKTVSQDDLDHWLKGTRQNSMPQEASRGRPPYFGSERCGFESCRGRQIKHYVGTTTQAR